VYHKGKLKDRDQEIQGLLTRDQLKDEVIAGFSDQLFEIKEKIKEFEKFRIMNNVFINKLRRYDGISSILSGLVSYRIMTPAYYRIKISASG